MVSSLRKDFLPKSMLMNIICLGVFLPNINQAQFVTGQLFSCCQPAQPSAHGSVASAAKDSALVSAVEEGETTPLVALTKTRSASKKRSLPTEDADGIHDDGASLHVLKKKTVAEEDVSNADITGKLITSSKRKQQRVVRTDEDAVPSAGAQQAIARVEAFKSLTHSHPLNEESTLLRKTKKRTVGSTTTRQTETGCCDNGRDSRALLLPKLTPDQQWLANRGHTPGIGNGGNTCWGAACLQLYSAMARWDALTSPDLLSGSGEDLPLSEEDGEDRKSNLQKLPRELAALAADLNKGKAYTTRELRERDDETDKDVPAGLWQPVAANWSRRARNRGKMWDFLAYMARRFGDVADFLPGRQCDAGELWVKTLDVFAGCLTERGVGIATDSGNPFRIGCVRQRSIDHYWHPEDPDFLQLQREGVVEGEADANVKDTFERKAKWEPFYNVHAQHGVFSAVGRAFESAHDEGFKQVERNRILELKGDELVFTFTHNVSRTVPGRFYRTKRGTQSPVVEVGKIAQKDAAEVPVSFALDVGSGVEEGVLVEKVVFELAAYVWHSGASMNGGHYLCTKVRQGRGGTDILYNDDRVSFQEHKSPGELGRSVVVALYKRKPQS